MAPEAGTAGDRNPSQELSQRESVRSFVIGGGPNILPYLTGDNPMNAARLAGLLSMFGIAPRQIRIGGQRCRGYELADFVPVFERVLSDGGA